MVYLTKILYGLESEIYIIDYNFCSSIDDSWPHKWARAKILECML